MVTKERDAEIRTRIQEILAKQREIILRDKYITEEFDTLEKERILLGDELMEGW